MARSCNPGVGIERRDTMNPSLWTPTYIKKKLLSSPSCGAIEKSFSGNPSRQKTGDPMQRTPWGIRFFRSRPAGGGVCSRKFSPAIRQRPAATGGNPFQWSSTGIRRSPAPVHSGSGVIHPETLIAHGSKSLQEENRENENYCRGRHVFNFALQAAGTLTIFPPRSTKA